MWKFSRLKIDGHFSCESVRVTVKSSFAQISSPSSKFVKVKPDLKSLWCTLFLRRQRYLQGNFSSWHILLATLIFTGKRPQGLDFLTITLDLSWHSRSLLFLKFCKNLLCCTHMRPSLTAFNWANLIYEIRIFIFSTWGSQKKWVRSRIFDDFEENFRSECRSVMSVVCSGSRGPLRGGRSGGRSEWSSEMSEENFSKNHQNIRRSHSLSFDDPQTLKKWTIRDLEWDPNFAFAMSCAAPCTNVKN